MFQKYLKELKPRNYSQIYATTAILRPGPMSSDFHKLYIKLQNGTATPAYTHPSMKNALELTGGIAIFQEQIMKLAVDMAGYTLVEADNMRSIIGKKKRDKMPLEREKFINGCIKNKIKRSIAETVFGQIEGWAGYGFNLTISVEEEVRMSDDTDRQMQDVNIGEHIKSRDEITKQKIDVEVVDKFYHEAELFEFVFDNGKTVRCSMEHKYRVEDGRILPMYQIIAENLNCVES
jgi:DNA polymerase-3 subunit alpha